MPHSVARCWAVVATAAAHLQLELAVAPVRRHHVVLFAEPKDQVVPVPARAPRRALCE